MDKIRDVLTQFGEKYKETPEDLLSLFNFAIDKNEDNLPLLNSLIFPESPIISIIHPDEKKTALHYACSAGHYKTNLIEILIDLGANINAPDSEGNTPLHDAIEFGANSLTYFSHLLGSGPHNHLFNNAEMLIKNGADVDISNNYGISPIQSALLSGHLEALEIFLKEDEKLPEVFSRTKRIQHLVKCFLKNTMNGIISSSIQFNLFRFTILQRDNESLKYILENTDVDLTAKDLGYTLLHIAAREGTPFMIKALVDKGFDLDDISDSMFNATPLIEAIKEGIPENVQCLLDCGASVNLVENDEFETYSPMLYALTMGNLEIVQMLVKHGVDVKSDPAPLLTASGSPGPENFALNSTIPIIKFFLDQGADIEGKTISAETEEGMTPLDRSCEAGNLEIVKLLLSRGAKINNEDFKTLRCAIVGQNGDIVRIILKRGICVNFSSLKYGTPLQFAINKDGCFFHNSRIQSDIANILVAFIAKMMASNEYVSEENKKLLENESVRQIYKACQEEIQSMKVKMINPSIRLSFFDILVKEIDILGGDLIFDNILKILDEGDYKNEFPKYAQDLEERIQEVKKRRPLVDWGLVMFKKHVEEKLPIEIVFLIFKSLNLRDLYNFSEACFFKLHS